MINIMKQNGKDAYGVTELIVDSNADVATLSTDYAPGSTCFVVEDSSLYMLNGNKAWILI